MKSDAIAGLPMSSSPHSLPQLALEAANNTHTNNRHGGLNLERRGRARKGMKEKRLTGGNSLQI